MNQKSPIINTARFGCVLFDIKYGSMQLDPDRGEQRTDSLTHHAIVTAPMFTRKIRDDAVRLGHEIYGGRGVCYERQNKAAAIEAGVALKTKSRGKKNGNEDDENENGYENENSYEVAEKIYNELRRKIDVRLFGQMVPGLAGTLRGTIHHSMAVSIDPVTPMRATLTRVATATEKEEKQQGGANRTMGSLSYVPYTLFRAHWYVDQHDAYRNGCTEADYDFYLDRLERLFEHDKSSARQTSCVRALYEFRVSEKATGPIHQEQILEAIRVQRRDATKPARFFEDYVVTIPKKIQAATGDLGDFKFRRIVDERNPWLEDKSAEEAAE